MGAPQPTGCVAAEVWVPRPTASVGASAGRTNRLLVAVLCIAREIDLRSAIHHSACSPFDGSW